MGSPAGKSIVITGANGGLGKELARQLALRDDVAAIYLGCRDPNKGRAALESLERCTGRSIFRVVVMDVASPDSVRTAIAQIAAPVDAVVCNAGGMGGPHPFELTPEGVTEIFASNLLGHVVLLESLISSGALTGVAVLTGSEAARGVAQLRIPQPSFAVKSADEFASVIDGSFFAGRKRNASLAYAQVKYLGALWMSALARRHTGLRFITMSPGNSFGTDVLRELPPPARFIAQRIVMPHVAPMFKLSHPVDVGASRLVRAVTDPTLHNGVFYASARGALSGPVVDQSTILTDFGDAAVQDYAVEAIGRFAS